MPRNVCQILKLDNCVMKKLLVAGAAVIFIFASAPPAEAYFWSNWFKKQAPAAEKKSVVNVKEAERKIKILEQVVSGQFLGNPNISVSFAQEEINQAVLPLMEKYLRNFVDQQSHGVQAKITDITLGAGSLEVSGSASQPIKSKTTVGLGLKVYQGKLALQIQKVKIGWFILPQAVINKGMERFNIKPENLVFPLPNFTLTELKIGNGEISIGGKYAKRK